MDSQNIGDDVEMAEGNEGCSDSVDPEEEKKRPRAGGPKPRVYLPGDPLGDFEELVCNESAYVMLHHAQTESPCLSFDLIPCPELEESDFPVTAYIVAGTQAPHSQANSLIVMKMFNMLKTQKPEKSESDDDSDDSEESDESDDDDDEEGRESKVPKLASVFMNHSGCVNRIRSTICEHTVLAASWSELERVNIWDLSTQLQAVDNETLRSRYIKNNVHSSVKPLFSFKGHQIEGFALDWCSTKTGVLASGDNRHGIHIWHPSEGGTWFVDQRPLVGHSQGVEDLQWSPNERNVLASCSVDKSIRIWDTRSPPQKACKITVENAHELDVNVINWNKNEPLIVSGGDDGILHVWDLRNFKTGSSVASFKHHTAPVTTVEWHPTDGTVFASGGADNQIALWDIAVERDEESDIEDIKNLPSQLLFIHQGQVDIKELHWHSQFSGVLLSTALNGFNVFKTISV